jgi:hypothetical protein
MVRDARWEDVNGDKKKELIVVGDWMSPVIFTLKGKKLEKMTNKGKPIKNEEVSVLIP